nr:hypothetical protein B0A51_08185 [Rachicladosporium sp. CCFEE 5018]
MPVASPQPQTSAMSPSPLFPGSGGLRPSLMKRHSSQSSNGYTRHSSRDVTSPGSNPSEAPLQPRHAVRPKTHARVVLPRNHSSGRNLAKMARQAANGPAHGPAGAQTHVRQRSHEGDTEIRLPGSLNESVGVPNPPIRRNMTSSQLPRNTSHTKLKKNYSHGQLQRLGSGKNLAALGSTQRAPPSPGLRPKSKRPKSADFGKVAAEKDLHQQEVELAEQLQAKRDGPKKVGFAVGSSDDTSDAEEVPEMEGSGMQEDEWTEESASASPYSTRQNTADNSRRPSVVQDRPSGKVEMARALANEVGLAMAAEVKAQREGKGQEAEADGTPAASYEDEDAGAEARADNDDDEEAEEEEEDDDDDEEHEEQSEEEDQPSPRSMPRVERRPNTQRTAQDELPSRPAQHQRVVSTSKEHANPTTQFLRRNSAQLAAPARISNITALDDVHSKRSSPDASMDSSRNLSQDPADQDELVSRFLPSGSHPATSSGTNTMTQNTPKHSHFHTPEEDSTLAAQHRGSISGRVPISPGGSTVSGSSGAATPALGRSRTELKMLQEKAIAEMESLRPPAVPAHVYDRRNESLKSYLNLAAAYTATAEGSNSISGLPMERLASSTLGPEIFQGRFKAVHTELRVVQKFRDPFAESIARLQRCKGLRGKLGLPPPTGPGSKPQLQLGSRGQTAAQGTAAALRGSKSAVSLPVRDRRPPEMAAIGTPPTAASQHLPNHIATSASPPKNSISPAKPALTVGSRGVVATRTGPQRRGVSFAGAPPIVKEPSAAEAEGGAEAVARKLWHSVLEGGS